MCGENGIMHNVDVVEDQKVIAKPSLLPGTPAYGFLALWTVISMYQLVCINRHYEVILIKQTFSSMYSM
jgi:hypothetical protein